MAGISVFLDLIGPQNITANINSGATFTSNPLCDLSFSSTDTDLSEILIWGDVDPAYNASIQPLKANAQWLPYTATRQIKLSTSDGSKTISYIIRDDVDNESAQGTLTITLDTSVPTVTYGAANRTKISKNPGKDVLTFTIQPDTDVVEYKIMAVDNLETALHDTVSNVQIPVTNGSTNVGGTGTFAAAGAINVSINAKDLDIAKSGHGQKYLKAFIKDAAGNWSV